jgi:hypothetical protein
MGSRPIGHPPSSCRFGRRARRASHYYQRPTFSSPNINKFAGASKERHMAKRKRRLNFNDIERVIIRIASILLLIVMLLKGLLTELKTCWKLFR